MRNRSNLLCAQTSAHWVSYLSYLARQLDKPKALNGGLRVPLNWSAPPNTKIITSPCSFRFVLCFMPFIHLMSLIFFCTCYLHRKIADNGGCSPTWSNIDLSLYYLYRKRVVFTKSVFSVKCSDSLWSRVISSGEFKSRRLILQFKSYAAQLYHVEKVNCFYG